MIQASRQKAVTLLRPRGFTLVEILVVMAILGLLTLVGYGKFSSFTQRWGLERLTDSLSNTIRTAGTVAEGEGHAIRVSVDLDNDRFELDVCKHRTGCDVNDSSDWGELSGLESVEASSPAIFYRFTDIDASDVFRTGTHRFILTPDGRARPNEGEDPTAYAIHLTQEPAPDESERCEFRTVAIVPNTIHPRQYGYGRFGPFRRTQTEC